jgi:hypothetical protein
VVGKSPLTPNPSPLRAEAWATSLAHYPGDLKHILPHIIRNGADVGYSGPSQLILSRNLKSATLAPDIITSKLTADLELGRVVKAEPVAPYICSPLGLVPKHNGSFRRIHHLSFPAGRSVNDHIASEFSALTYVVLEDIWTDIVLCGRYSVIVKKDVADAFRIIPIAQAMHWLFGFSWNDEFYTETCLPFGLSTSPIIFNLFAEAFHWILQSNYHWNHLHHYLDDFIRVIPPTEKTAAMTLLHHEEWDSATTGHGIPRQPAKDAQGQVVDILGIEHDTRTFEARLSAEKLTHAQNLTSAAVKKRSISLLEAQSLAGYLSFCAKVAPLGRTFLSNIWDFIASFSASANFAAKRSMPRSVRADLSWWNRLLPRFNGVHLFGFADRPIVHLFTDASNQGLGGFYFKSSCTDDKWLDHCASIPASNAFATLHTRRKRCQHINTHEMRAILHAFKRWGEVWKKCAVIIHTDNTTAQSGINRGRVHGPSMEPLRELLVLAAALDIDVSATWISTNDNTLADALSRFQAAIITDLCPHWQNTALLQNPGFKKQRTRQHQSTPASCGTVLSLAPAGAINLRSPRTKISATLPASAPGQPRPVSWVNGSQHAHTAPPSLTWVNSRQIQS